MDFRTLPKSDLHAHISLSAPRASYEGGGAPIPAPPARFGHLHQFLDYIVTAFGAYFQRPGSSRAATANALDHMISDRIVYAEPSFDLFVLTMSGEPLESIIEACAAEVSARAGKIHVSPDLGIAREIPQELWMPTAERLLKTGFFEGVDLYGRELHTDVSDFEHFFDMARSRGMRIKLHSGEIGDPSRISRELDIVRPSAIQHGVRAAEDPRLMERLARDEVVLNVCPTSNFRLSVVDEYAGHPIRALYDAGVKVTLNSDDFAVFDTTVSEEMQKLYDEGMFSLAELERMR
ncbi:MAG: hypothetical protein IT290_04390, partial [Deltaproteobacteria bacterium]|nr:hypothetical protein [Deltaproteobacteria bacterium]